MTRETIVLAPEDLVIPHQRGHAWTEHTPAACYIATLMEHCWLRDHPDEPVDIPDDLGHRPHVPQHERKER